jgi:thiamine-monophosphate kinase
MNALARRYDMAIVGGETTKNGERVHMISVALIGTVAREKCIRRSGSRPGDALFVTGQLGGSLSGRHLDFEPRLKEALACPSLSGSRNDRSDDGLAGDLRHLLKAGNLGAELLKTAIPISRDARLKAQGETSAKPPLLAALTDGEDFELLFTVTSSEAVRLLDAWKKEFPNLALSCIGKMTAEPGLRLRDKDGIRPLTAHGYLHFS